MGNGALVKVQFRGKKQKSNNKVKPERHIQTSQLKNNLKKLSFLIYINAENVMQITC